MVYHAVLPAQPLGPPPVFPEMDLPEHSDLTAKDTLLLVGTHVLTDASSGISNPTMHVVTLFCVLGFGDI